MIPEVGAVVAAAKAFAASGVTAPGMGDLLRALDALEIRETRAAGGPTYEEQDRTWGEVVVQDEILSDKTGKWYEVASSGLTKDGRMKLSIKGSSKVILRDPTAPVRVKRGVMGDAADTFQLSWSGTTIRGAAVTAHMAEVVNPHTDTLEVASAPETKEEEETDESE